MSKAHVAGNSDEYLFHPISSSGNRKRLVSINKPISYPAYGDSFKKSPRHLALFSLVFTYSVSLNLVNISGGPYLSQLFYYFT